MSIIAKRLRKLPVELLDDYPDIQAAADALDAAYGALGMVLWHRAFSESGIKEQIQEAIAKIEGREP